MVCGICPVSRDTQIIIIKKNTHTHTHTHTHTYIYIHKHDSVYVYSTLPLQAGCDTKSIFQAE